jgi:hypothetical protein
MARYSFCTNNPGEFGLATPDGNHLAHNQVAGHGKQDHRTSVQNGGAIAGFVQLPPRLWHPRQPFADRMPDLPRQGIFWPPHSTRAVISARLKGVYRAATKAWKRKQRSSPRWRMARKLAIRRLKHHQR